MREILFRGKRADNGECVVGYLYITHNGEYEISSYSAEIDIERMTSVVIPETVGQYTGLTDKNGKKIFEGDIIKTKYGRLCIVVWFSSPTYVGWDLNVVETVDNCLHTRKPDFSDLYYSDNLEIVGNIHDNPELLEVEL